MSTIVTRIIHELLGRPSSTRGILWSLGLHATAFFATYAWWSNPIAPISFAGSRYVVQIEATFSDMSTEEEIETMLDIESTPPLSPMLEDEFDDASQLVELAPAELPRMKRELVIAPVALQLSERPLQDGDDDETIEVEPPHGASSTKEPSEIKPVETPKKPRQKPAQPPKPEAHAVVEQFAGVEDRTPADLSDNRSPVYPAEAIRGHLEGTVLLRVHIAASGDVERVEIVRSSGSTILDRTAKEAVSTWHSRPAEQGGNPVATVELLPVRFRL